MLPRTAMWSAFLVSLVALCVCFSTTSVAATGFHSCASQKLENQGIFHLKASHAKCKLAREVAYGRMRGDETPKGFSCVPGPGGNLEPFTCARRSQTVKFSLEG